MIRYKLFEIFDDNSLKTIKTKYKDKVVVVKGNIVAMQIIDNNLLKDIQNDSSLNFRQYILPERILIGIIDKSYALDIGIDDIVLYDRLGTIKKVDQIEDYIFDLNNAKCDSEANLRTHKLVYEIKHVTQEEFADIDMLEISDYNTSDNKTVLYKNGLIECNGPQNNKTLETVFSIIASNISEKHINISPIGVLSEYINIS